MTRPVLFDVDPGCDDAVMLALALASDEIEVVGVTTVAGNAELSDTTRNALAVLEVFDRTDVPVVPGCDRPLVEPLETAEDVHGAGGLPGHVPDGDGRHVDAHAVDVLLERSRTVEDLCVVGTGPLSNIAVAMAIDPGLPERLDTLAVMGGALDVGGNVTDAAEYNFYADPDAAARVVREAGPQIVGLDVTERATLPPETIEGLLGGDERSRTVAGWLAYATPATLDSAGVGASRPLHDPLVLVDLLDGVLAYEETALAVEHGSGPTRGALASVDPGSMGDRLPEFAVDIDVEAFRSRTIDRLDGLA